MASFEILRFPVLNESGVWTANQPTDWTVRFEAISRSLFVKAGRQTKVVSLANVLALQILEEKQVTDVGKTLRRMTLTGVGASLFFENGDAIGAGLLDLSARGAIKKAHYSGILIFHDSTIIRFALPALQFEQLAKVLPETAFDEGALGEANHMFDLLNRMKMDGRRALDELAQQLRQAFDESKSLARQVEAGATFIERDQARARATAARGEVERMKYLLIALLFDHGINPSAFLFGNADRPSLKDVLEGNDTLKTTTEERVAENDRGVPVYAQEPNGLPDKIELAKGRTWAWPVVIGAMILVIILFLMFA